MFVIIGWSSQREKIFYYRVEHESWETIYPAHRLSYDEDLKNFYNTYVEKFWNDVEYVERYIQQNLLLHYYLKEHNIDHIFFDAFYELKVKEVSSILLTLTAQNYKSRIRYKRSL